MPVNYEEPISGQAELEKPVNYQDILFRLILDAGTSFKGEVDACDAMVLALRSLLLPDIIKNAKYKRERVEIEKKLDDARQKYINNWGTEQKRYRWDYLEAVNRHFEILIKAASDVQLLGGRRARKSFYTK